MIGRKETVGRINNPIGTDNQRNAVAPETAAEDAPRGGSVHQSSNQDRDGGVPQAAAILRSGLLIDPFASGYETNRSSRKPQPSNISTPYLS